jgi:hypothetical protein
MMGNANPYRPTAATPAALPRGEIPEPVSFTDRILCGLGRALSAVGFTTFVLATAVTGYRVVGATLLERGTGLAGTALAVACAATGASLVVAGCLLFLRGLTSSRTRV